MSCANSKICVRIKNLKVPAILRLHSVFPFEYKKICPTTDFESEITVFDASWIGGMWGHSAGMFGASFAGAWTDSEKIFDNGGNLADDKCAIWSGRRSTIFLYCRCCIPLIRRDGSGCKSVADAWANRLHFWCRRVAFCLGSTSESLLTFPVMER